MADHDVLERCRVCRQHADLHAEYIHERGRVAADDRIGYGVVA